MSVRRALVTAAAGLALAGLLVMHGLVGHGVSGPDTDGHHAHAAAAGHGDPVGATTDGPAVGSVDGRGHGNALAALCLALLAGLGVALLLRGRAVLVGAPVTLAVPATWPPYARSGDPPSHVALCVHRC